MLKHGHRSFLFDFFVCILVIGDLRGEATAPLPSLSTPVLSVATGRTAFSAVYLPNLEQVLVLGGFVHVNSDPQPAGTVDAYALNGSLLWSRSGMPTPRGHMCSTVLIDGDDYLVVAVGGSQSVSGDYPLASVEVFNTTSLTWDVWSNLTYPRVNATCTVGFGGVVVGLGVTYDSYHYIETIQSVEYILLSNYTYLLTSLPISCIKGVLTTLSDTSIAFVSWVDDNSDMGPWG